MKDHMPTPSITRKRHNSEQTTFKRELNVPSKACGICNYVYVIVTVNTQIGMSHQNLSKLAGTGVSLKRINEYRS